MFVGMHMHGCAQNLGFSISGEIGVESRLTLCTFDNGAPYLVIINSINFRTYFDCA